METKKKLLYEPPVMEVFEIKTKVILQGSNTPNSTSDPDDYTKDPSNPLYNG